MVLKSNQDQKYMDQETSKSDPDNWDQWDLESASTTTTDSDFVDLYSVNDNSDILWISHINSVFVPSSLIKSMFLKLSSY